MCILFHGWEEALWDKFMVMQEIIVLALGRVVAGLCAMCSARRL